MKILFQIILVFLCYDHLQAQPLLTVGEAVALAIENNYDVRLVKNETEAFAIDNRYADAAFIPRLNATAGRIWNDNSQRQDFTDGRKRSANVNSNNLTASVSLDWTLFDGLKMFVTRERLKELQSLGEANVRTQITNSAAEVITLYYNIVQQRQQLKALDSLMLINRERVELAERKLEVGLGSKPELLQAKVDLNAQITARMQQATSIAQMKDQLNRLIGIPLDNAYEVADSIPIRSGLAYGELMNELELTNPGLIATRKNIGIAELLVRERKAERLPVFQFNSAYNFGRTTNASVVNPEFQPIFSLNNGFNYGFTAIIPLLNGFNTRREVRQAGLIVDYNKIAYEAQKAQVELDLRNAYKNYRYQLQALALEEENIELAKENVFISLARFRQGVSTYLELREAQLSLEQAYNRLIAARYNTKVSETELLRLKGTLLPLR